MTSSYDQGFRVHYVILIEMRGAHPSSLIPSLAAYNISISPERNGNASNVCAVHTEYRLHAHSIQATDENRLLLANAA